MYLNGFRKNKLICVSFFLFANIIFWSRPFFGLDFSDSFFHINIALYSELKDYYVPFFLSSEIIRVLALIFGENLISFRLFNAFLLYLSLLSPFFILKGLKHTPSLWYISCGLLIFYPLNVNILGYDTLSVFILSLIFSFTCKYVLTQKTWVLLLLAVLSAIAVFIRLPNAVTLFILAGIIWFHGTLRSCIIYFMLTVFSIAVGYLVYFKNLEGFLNAWYATDTHTLPNLLAAYLKDVSKLLFYVISVIAIYFFRISLKSWKLSYSYKLLILTIVITLYLFLVVGFTAYWRNFSLFLTATVIACGALNLLTNNFPEQPNFKKFVLLLVPFLLVIPSGSDTGLLKACFMFILFPFVLALSKSKNNFWQLVLILLVPFSLAQGVLMTYQDSAVYNLSKTPEIQKISGVYTSRQRAAFIEAVHGKIEKLRERGFKILVYGDKSHILKYLYPESFSMTSFHQSIASIEDLNNFKALMPKGKTAIFMFYDYPPDAGRELPDEFVKENNLKKISQDRFEYYIKD